MAAKSSRDGMRRLIAVLSLLASSALNSIAVAASQAPSVSIAGDESSMTVIVEEARLRDVLEYLAHYQSLLVESCVALKEPITVEIIAMSLEEVLGILLADYEFELTTGEGAPQSRRLRIVPKFACSASCESDAEIFGPQ